MRLLIFIALAITYTLDLTAIPNKLGYYYSLDLNKVDNDRLKVEVELPRQSKSEIIFALPKIVPGTYSISDFGRFVDGLEAYDAEGARLKVKRLNDNQWQISKANKLTKISYWVEDTYDSDKPNIPLPMAGTNIEANENFVINTFAFFGYLDNMRELPYTVEITKPKGFYGSTALQPVYSDEEKDIFWTESYFRLTDAPIMYAQPDIARIQVSGAEVLIGVYSPNKTINASYLAANIEETLRAQADYLGGSLPVDHYAFLLYFADNDPMVYGALEHHKCSFYFLPELPAEIILPMVRDIVAHEFFHIVTPLNLHAQEIQYFNFDEPILSEHLWLYEGITEYSAQHFQVREGLKTIDEYLADVQNKMTEMTQLYNDTLPFTVMSKSCATTYEDQYGNVYQKGAIIGLCLDIELLDWSNGKYRLMDLEKDLTKLYGPHKPFKDESLFDDIAGLTAPRIKDFLVKYVAGPSPLPLKQVLNKVGIDYTGDGFIEEFSLGQVGLGFNPATNRLMVSNVNNLNEFGKKMGYQVGDEIYAINGVEFAAPLEAIGLLDDLKKNMSVGNEIALKIKRPNEEGGYDDVVLKSPAMKSKKTVKHQMTLMTDPSERQLMLRDRWLDDQYEESLKIEDANKNKTINDKIARSENASFQQYFTTADAVVSNLYKFVSGQLGEKRDWDLFRAFFTSEALMNVVEPTEEGNKIHTITVEDYIKYNSKVMEEIQFTEKELGRKSSIYGNIASVISSYEANMGPRGIEQGINQIQLINKNNRWYITHLQWQGADGQNPIPTLPLP